MNYPPLVTLHNWFQFRQAHLIKKPPTFPISFNVRFSQKYKNHIRKNKNNADELAAIKMPKIVRAIRNYNLCKTLWLICLFLNIFYVATSQGK